eukprot:TRINITY_DN12768_c1_g2_i1.p1 TRINITY_DN12768_c1_g2~~TRINITY_DN12768_c1_g2_i1.p1  ORF type:complete len:267 (+),score=78.13 TRINITY_DN12768_c1_g2_i1:73-801(+)
MGDTYCVELESDAVVGDLKSQVAEAMGVDKRSVQLRCGDEVLKEDEVCVCECGVASDQVIDAEVMVPFRFQRCGEAGEIAESGWEFSLVRTIPDYAVAMLEPSIKVGGDDTQWAVHLTGSPRIDFGVTNNPQLDLNNHCRNNRNHIWHITGLTRTADKTYLTIYGDDAAGNVPYDTLTGVVIQFTLTPDGTLSCEFQHPTTRLPIPCYPQPIRNITGTVYPLWCFDDAATATIVSPHTTHRG